jgi:DNA polymerase V
MADTALSMLDIRTSQRTNGYPSPAEDFAEARLDLRDLLIRHPAATYYFRMEGEALCDAGIHAGDLLVVDRALPPLPGSLVIVAAEGELLARRYAPTPAGFVLLANAPGVEPISSGGDGEVVLWGVVTFAIHAVAPSA